MKITKRVLAIALAMFLSAGVFAIGSFATPLDDEGAALLQSTYNTLNSKNFTIKMHDSSVSYVMTRDGDRIVSEQDITGFIPKLLFGRKMRSSIAPGQVCLGFPERRFYVDLARLLTNRDEMEEFLASTCDLLIASPEPVSVENATVDGTEYICVTALETEGRAKLYYLNEQLKLVDSSDGNRLVIDLISTESDQSVLTAPWMIKLPFWLLMPFLSAVV